MTVALAARVEQLTGPCRETDALIAVAVGWFSARKGQKSDVVDYVDIREAGKENWPGYGGDQLVPHLTGSFDAAMTLVPAGAEWEMTNLYGVAQVNMPLNAADGWETTRREDGNLILAFVECCLKARSALEASHG